MVHSDIYYGGIERPSHIFVNIMLSNTDDLETCPHDITPTTVS